MTQDTINEVMQAQAAQIGAMFTDERERMQPFWAALADEAQAINNLLQGVQAQTHRRKTHRR
jgi:hypothetical protein